MGRIKLRFFDEGRKGRMGRMKNKVSTLGQICFSIMVQKDGGRMKFMSFDEGRKGRMWGGCNPGFSMRGGSGGWGG